MAAWLVPRKRENKMEKTIELDYVILGSLFLIFGWLVFSAALTRRLDKKAMELARSECQYRSLFEQHEDGILMLDDDNIIVRCNHSSSVLLGTSSTSLIGLPSEEITSRILEENREEARAWFEEALRRGSGSFETALAHSKGYAIELSLTVMRFQFDDHKEKHSHYVWLRDRTKEHQTEEKLKNLAYQDELTGLPNRRWLNHELGKRLRPSSGEVKTFALLAIDLDRFKLINDSFGHASGDQFLQMMSNRLEKVTARHEARIARIGGDEFIVIVDSREQVRDIIPLAEQLLSALQFPFRLQETDVYVTASIGIAMCPAHGEDEAELLRHADEAMYEAKRLGKNGYRIYRNIEMKEGQSIN